MFLFWILNANFKRKYILFLKYNFFCNYVKVFNATLDQLIASLLKSKIKHIIQFKLI